MKFSIKWAVAGVLVVAAAGTAAAQVQMPGFFGNLDGFYGFRAGNGDDIEQDYLDTNPRPGDAFGGSGRVGYMFPSLWDVALGGTYANFTPGPVRGFPTNNKLHISDAWFFNIDGEVGRNFSGQDFGLRVFGGVRYQQWRHELHYEPDNPCCFTNNRSWGIGPRIGFEGAVRLGMSAFSLMGGFDAALLFGRVKSTGGTDPGISRGSTSRTTYDLDGRAGLDWEVAPFIHLVAGYQARLAEGVFFTHDNFNRISDDQAFPPSGRGTRLVHGPFVRVAYNIGAPRAMPVAMVAPAPAPQSTGSFIIFFDWDRSVLTPQAKDTVKTASDAFKAKGSARVTLTGHADRSGSDQYNMALSLRRGAATKDELVRNGVPANAIVIIGKGESQPLVPTADGVREPQNRRVEIVLQ